MELPKIDPVAYDKWKLSDPHDEEKVVAFDYFGQDIYEGSGFYWKDENGEYISPEDVDSYMANTCDSEEF